ncbi:putative bifunctional diguanylate cyclase/phosphodiesterase [Devosia nitrariae]|uniref:EAL domain-containing protein n=1 Tax=Devosia nitrariae TaxID=2071872 RepID=A0ABQ5W2Q1_9HYPH|nr:bifunctional diguanylate cyclase/phosphodiesterase [Devosia nitrariae]GLQ54180.1 hypothetical protein GCM10010862_14390 [Devosia nitrariae]
MLIRLIRTRLALLVSVLVAIVMSAATIFSFYNTLNEIENSLPNFGFFSMRELNLAIRDVAHLKDMVTLARLAPDQQESIDLISKANDLVYVRFGRQDQASTIRGYPTYGPAVTRARAVVARLDRLLDRGPPLSVLVLTQVGEELAATKDGMADAYHAFGQATNVELAEIQIRLGQLNVLTAIVLSVFSAMAIGVAVLLVNRHRTLRFMRHLAWHDPLTELKNRAWLLTNAEGVLRRATGANRSVALLLIDVDRFKEVNDTFGHAAGDALLKAVGRLLLDVEKRCAGHAVRLGGDEFALLLPIASRSILQRVTDELREGLNTRLDLDGIETRMSASIGVARFPEHAADLGALLRCADYALYSAKARGGGYDVLFSPEAAHRMENQHRLDAAIRSAIAADELFLNWQPQYELTTGRLSGAEALVSWHDPTTGRTVPAAEFIPAAEGSELILDIDRFVLTKACQQAVAWRAEVPGDFTFSVNISAKHMQRPDLPEFVRKTLSETGLEPGRLELEITESAFIENKQAALKVLSQLQAFGVRFALDDFGTGYSSLSYLIDLDVTRLKIDRSFISNVMVSTGKRNVVQSIMALAHSLDLDIVAEGVETPEQTAFLMQLGCRYAQGFLLSRPISPDELTGLLASKNRVTPELIEGAKRILAA